MRTTFCYPAADLDRLRALDPDRDWRAFQGGQEAWILGTYLRLAAAGVPVELAAHLPDEDGLVILHAKHKRAFAADIARLRRAKVAIVRGDLRGELLGADFEIVQNLATDDGRRRHFVPHWSQPGLLPRDPQRGDRLETVAFKGNLENLNPPFRTAAWHDLLRARGITFDCDAVPFSPERAAREALQWTDYRSVDAILAVRPPRIDLRGKPAAKLYNAWLAGAPALLGREPAYREIRRSPLDYLEVDSVEEARQAIDRLRDEPGLYRAMVENGHRRGADYAPAATLAAWRELLERVLPPLLADSRTILAGRRRLFRYVDWLRFASRGSGARSR